MTKSNISQEQVKQYWQNFVRDVSFAFPAEVLAEDLERMTRLINDKYQSAPIDSVFVRCPEAAFYYAIGEMMVDRGFPSNKKT